MSRIPTPVKAGSQRVWTVEGGVHPTRSPVFQPIVKPDDPSQSFGDVTKIEIPDPDKYNSFRSIGEFQGEIERAQFGLTGRYPINLSDLLRLARKRCRVDMYVLVGECKNPQNFTTGWEKIVYFPEGKISTWSAENFGAMESGEQNPTNEIVEMSSDAVYEFGQMGFARLAETEATREILTIDVCDNESCGDCDDESDGCQRVIATMLGLGATPGTVPTALFSADNGVTWSSDLIDTMTSTEVPSDGACIGENFVLVSSSAIGLHYTNVDELYDLDNTWTEVNTGFVIGGEPNAISSCDVNNTWIVGDGGFIYFTQNPVQGVTVQNAGVATTQNLLDVNAYDSQNILAVGSLNAVVFSENGGETWSGVTGPNVGVELSTCHMWSPGIWFVGDVLGNLWLTENAGNTWTEKTLNLGGVTRIDKITFVDEAEGYLAVRVGTGAARVLRTITGGFEWYALPDGKNSTVPAADQFNDLAVCTTGSNTVFTAGLDDDGTTGIIVKAEA